MAQTPLVQDRTPLNEVKYGGRDFQSIFDALLRRAKVQFGDVYNDFVATTQGVMLMDLAAYAAQLIGWALDRTASDCFLSTVRTPAPAEWHARALGYKMYAAAASSADLVLTFAAGIPGPYTMGAGWRYQATDGTQFESVADVVLAISPPATTVAVAVRQGQTRQLSYVGDGTAFQHYNLEYAGDGEYIADGSVRVWVDGAEWIEQDFLTYEATNQFEVQYQQVPPVVRFGDGSGGNVPPDGADIRIEFVKIVGSAGNVGAGTITTSLDTITIGGSAVAFTLTNALPARSGRDGDTVEHARRVAPYAFAARGGAVTRLDYQALASGYVDPLYGAVDKANAYTPRAAYEDVAFNALDDDIRAALATFDAAVAAAAASWAADVATINAEIAAIEAARSDLDALRTALVGEGAAISAGLATAKGELLANDGTFQTAVDADGDAVAGLDTLDAYVVANVAPGAVQTQILAYSAAVRGDVATMRACVDTARSMDSAARSTVEATAIQAAVLEGQVADGAQMADDLDAQATAVAALAAPMAAVTADIAAILAAAGVLDVTADADLTAMQARVGELFDDSCRSNVVQVPILAVDTDGNYIAPPSGLMASLQSYLDTYKEVTQYVEVIDGTVGLVAVDWTITYHMQDGFVAAEAAADIGATVRGLMRGREYGVPLYLSDGYRYVQTCNDGLAYVTVDLNSTTTSVVVGENIVPAQTQILILGTLSIVEV